MQQSQIEKDSAASSILPQIPKIPIIGAEQLTSGISDKKKQIQDISLNSVSIQKDKETNVKQKQDQKQKAFQGKIEEVKQDSIKQNNEASIEKNIQVLIPQEPLLGQNKQNQIQPNNKENTNQVLVPQEPLLEQNNQNQTEPKNKENINQVLIPQEPILEQNNQNQTEPKNKEHKPEGNQPLNEKPQKVQKQQKQTKVVFQQKRQQIDNEENIIKIQAIEQVPKISDNQQILEIKHQQNVKISLQKEAQLNNQVQHFESGEEDNLNQQYQKMEKSIQIGKSEEQDKLKPSKSRVKQIQAQKLRIAAELKKLDMEIAQIKGEHLDTHQNEFIKRQKINQDQQAKKNAQRLVKQLKQQRRVLQERRKRQQQKLLEHFKKEEQEKRIIREEQLERAKEQRRAIIQKRMQEQKRRKEERKIIQEQSNQMIVQLKKEQHFQKERIMVPSQMIQIQHQKKALENKKKLDFGEIEEHQRRYRELKAKQSAEKLERSQSIKYLEKQEFVHKRYAKNHWMRQLEDQNKKKEDEQKQKQYLRRNQLQKRLKYGELVKNIFLPKRKQISNSNDYETEQKKNHTPQQLPNVPSFKATNIQRKTYDNQIYKKQDLPTINNIKVSKKLPKLSSAKEFDSEKQQKERLKKIREAELRKMTNERIKKMQNKSMDLLIKKKEEKSKQKYQNYLGKVALKKQQNDEQELKKIINNEKLTSEQKYKQIMAKASIMENKAKLKQNLKHETDQDAIKLYIGSIQAKLAILQKF